MKKNNSRGAFLALTALILPVMIAFWGWIISGAMLLNIKISQQIAADCAVLSGVGYFFFEGNEARAIETANLFYQQYTPGTTYSIVRSGNNNNFTLTLNASLPVQSLFMTQSTTINTTAVAKRNKNANPETAVLLPLA